MIKPQTKPVADVKFDGARDERRCQHCYIGKRHTAEEHAQMLRYYDDTGAQRR